MKRILIGILIFVLYLACVVAGAFALRFSGTRFTLFCVVLGLLGGIAIVFALWYLFRASTGEAAKSDLINVDALMRDADRKLRTSRLTQISRFRTNHLRFGRRQLRQNPDRSPVRS